MGLFMDENNPSYILTINAGSSSMKLALFIARDNPEQFFEAIIDDIGLTMANLTIIGKTELEKKSEMIYAPDHISASKILVDRLKKQIPDQTIVAVGYRIVHGGPKYFEPSIINDEFMTALSGLTFFDPVHLPTEIKLIETFKELFPNSRHIACFDTHFHHNLPNLARLLPIPRHYESLGVRRYGFHGLSYSYVMEQLSRTAGPDVANGRVIIAHLGSGTSLVAVRNGRSIDTTMGLTPVSGVPMSTRSGDLDPGLPLYFARTEGLNPDQFSDLVNFRSGLLGISETTSDMKQLIEHENEDPRARETVDFFCYHIKKAIGSLAATLDGVDTLIFTGGMGEKAPKIRSRICDGLSFLGIDIDAVSNSSNSPVISSSNSQVNVMVIHTDESSTIAKNTWQLINSLGIKL
jgi:acetate kinase